jgi:hypothetical protein
MEYSPAAKINKSLKDKKKLIEESPSYNENAVDKEIGRSKQKISPSESKSIHALLKGRYAKGGKIDLDDCKVNTAEKRSNCHKHF